MTREKIIHGFITSMERERMRLGLTQAQMAKELEMSVSGYKKMIAGETAKIDLYIAYRMYKLTGKFFYDFCESHSDQVQIFRGLYELNSSQLKFIKGIVDFEIAFQNGSDQANAADYIDLITPTGNMEDGMIWDSINVEKINVAAYRKKFGAALHCALHVNSIHFHPVYNMGDILLISLVSPRDGDTGIFINRETGCAYLRRLRQTDPYVLEPINGCGVSFTIDPNREDDLEKWIHFGKVLTKMRQ